jgi:hypothetical protein
VFIEGLPFSSIRTSNNACPISELFIPQCGTKTVAEDAQQCFWALNSNNTRYKLVDNKGRPIIRWQKINFNVTTICGVLSKDERLLIYCNRFETSICNRIRTFKATNKFRKSLKHYTNCVCKQTNKYVFCPCILSYKTANEVQVEDKRTLGTSF